MNGFEVSNQNNSQRLDEDFAWKQGVNLAEWPGSGCMLLPFFERQWKFATDMAEIETRFPKRYRRKPKLREICRNGRGKVEWSVSPSSFWILRASQLLRDHRKSRLQSYDPDSFENNLSGCQFCPWDAIWRTTNAGQTILMAQCHGFSIIATFAANSQFDAWSRREAMFTGLCYRPTNINGIDGGEWISLGNL
jgi:hypothetical protein